MSEQLNPKHQIYQLSRNIDWPYLEDDFNVSIAAEGAQSNRFVMISLLLLKQQHDLSDDQVVERWIENRYWQFFSGEHILQRSAPVASSDLTHFRKRIGKKDA